MAAGLVKKATHGGGRKKSGKPKAQAAASLKKLEKCPPTSKSTTIPMPEAINASITSMPRHPTFQPPTEVLASSAWSDLAELCAGIYRSLEFTGFLMPAHFWLQPSDSAAADVDHAAEEGISRSIDEALPFSAHLDALIGRIAAASTGGDGTIGHRDLATECDAMLKSFAAAMAALAASEDSASLTNTEVAAATEVENRLVVEPPPSVPRLDPPQKWPHLTAWHARLVSAALKADLRWSADASPPEYALVRGGGGTDAGDSSSITVGSGNGCLQESATLSALLSLHLRGTIAEPSAVYGVRSGSHLYNLATSASDEGEVTASPINRSEKQSGHVGGF
jgi:hypothetical protein